MPIYEYQCNKCEHKLEALQKISAEPLTQCPACEKPELQKLVSAPNFRFKGGGWYETDFKTGNKKQLAESDSTDTENKKSDSDASSDVKTGAADATKPADKADKTNKADKTDKKSSDKQVKKTTTNAATKTAGKSE